MNRRERRAGLQAEYAAKAAMNQPAIGVAPANGNIQTDLLRTTSPVRYIIDQQFIRVRQDLLKLRYAIEAAENVTKYDRWQLHNVYREIIRDPQWHSQWESRKMKVKEKPFKLVNAKGEEDPMKTKVLEKEWFFDWIDAALDAKAWGFSMIEFGEWENEAFQPYQVHTTYAVKMYPSINVLVRDYVKPELSIISQTPNGNTGISFFDPEYSKNLMFIGKPYDFGLLFKVAPYILYKNNCIGNWSEWAEVFGMDTRVGYTTAEGEQRSRFIRAVRDFGSNQYAVLDPQWEEKIEFAGTTKSDAFKVYHELCKYVDEMIAKAVWGQDVVTNNTGRVVGTTGENIANMYGAADAKHIEFLVNSRLLPFIADKDYSGFKGYEFRWDNTEKVGMKDKADIDLKVSQMGFKIDPEYIEKTYGVPVEEKIENDNDNYLPTQKSLKALYE